MAFFELKWPFVLNVHRFVKRLSTSFSDLRILSGSPIPGKTPSKNDLSRENRRQRLLLEIYWDKTFEISTHIVVLLASLLFFFLIWPKSENGTPSRFSMLRDPQNRQNLISGPTDFSHVAHMGPGDKMMNNSLSQMPDAGPQNVSRYWM